MQPLLAHVIAGAPRLVSIAGRPAGAGSADGARRAADPYLAAAPVPRPPMTPFRILLLGLALAAVVLAAMNPGPEAFSAFLQKRVAAEAAERAAEASGGRLSEGVTDFLAERLGQAAAEAVDQEFEREDYFVCSVYRVDVNAWRPGGEVSFLGIAGQFFPLSMPEELRNL